MFSANSKSLNTFALLVFAATTLAMLASAQDNGVLKLISLGTDILIIVYALSIVGIKTLIISATKPIILLCIIILCANFTLSPYEPRFSLLIKYIGYFIIFLLGKVLAERGCLLSCGKIPLAILIFSPLLIVALLDRSDAKTTFFANSNVFVYVGLCSSLFYLCVRGANSKVGYVTALILLSYILTGTSLGVVVAVAGSFIVLSIKRVNVFMLVSFFALFVLFVLYSDVSVAVRIRDTLAVYKALDWNDWAHLSDVNFYELQQHVGANGIREDNTSSLWRIVQWIGLITEYIASPFNIPFGLGADYSIYKTGLPPHNDHILVLVEYGAIVYGALFYGLIKVYRRLKDYNVFYLILAIVFYHFTENLLDTFPPNCLFYFVLGYSYYSAIYK